MSREFLEEIISEKISESDTLEYKDYYFTNGKLTSLDQKELAKLFKEICALANYNGGRIILGLKEDNNHNPSELSDVGVNKDTFEMWEQALRNKLSVNIIPSLYGIKTELVEVRDDTNCIIIDVPRSVLKPHAYNTGSNHEFYIRNGNTSIQMRYNDLKNSFDSLSNRQQKLESFRSERISSILNSEVDDTLITSPLLLIHILPEVSFDERTYIDLKACEYNDNLDIFNPDGHHGSVNYNANGLIKTRRNHKDLLSTYIQIFSNGNLEIGEIYLMKYDVDENPKMIYCWDNFEKIIAKKIYNYCKELYKQRLGTGFYISFTLLNVKDYYSRTSGFGELSEPIKQNIIKSQFVKWDINTSYQSSMYLFFNKFANIFGSRESWLYNDGEPIAEKFNFIAED
ncbi:MAG: ATP-binding protein [Ezakiella sp.]|nr:ATP-binding protein [Ezakiella sp.]MDY3923389.1 ATP-binding protein [Ezakiella sp.]